MQGQGSKIKHQGVETKVQCQGSKVKGHRSRAKCEGSLFKYVGSRFYGPGSRVRFWVKVVEGVRGIRVVKDKVSRVRLKVKDQELKVMKKVSGVKGQCSRN